MTYDCMTPEELTLWQWGAQELARQTGYLTKKPCADCPLSFRREAQAAGCCVLVKGALNTRNRRYRARLREQVEGVRHEREQAEKRRAYNREWMRLARARAKGAQ